MALVIIGSFFAISMLCGLFLVHSGLTCDETKEMCFMPIDYKFSYIGRVLLSGFITSLISLGEILIYFLINLTIYSYLTEAIFYETYLLSQSLDLNRSRTLHKNNKKYLIIEIGKQDVESHHYPAKIIRKYYSTIHNLIYVAVYLALNLIIFKTNSLIAYKTMGIPLLLIVELLFHMFVN